VKEGGKVVAIGLPPAFTLVSRSPYSLILKMEATCSSVTLIDVQRAARLYIPEDRTLHFRSSILIL
jgi:hypothetical protein